MCRINCVVSNSLTSPRFLLDPSTFTRVRRVARASSAPSPFFPPPRMIYIPHLWRNVKPRETFREPTRDANWRRERSSPRASLNACISRWVMREIFMRDPGFIRRTRSAARSAAVNAFVSPSKIARKTKENSL